MSCKSKFRLPVGLVMPVIAILLSISGPGYSAGTDIELVRDGKTQFAVVLPSDPEPEENLAAQELIDAIRQMTGARLSIGKSTDNGSKIYLGSVEAFVKSGMLSQIVGSIPVLNPEQYVTFAQGGNFLMLGGSPQAVLWAVYGLLQDFGCRWYMPGKAGEVIPSRKHLSIGSDQRIMGPAFPYREIAFVWGRSPERQEAHRLWKQRNRFATPPIKIGHNFKASLPPEASFEKRPDLYALFGGQRVKQQICTTHPDVIRMVIRTINEYFDEHPDVLCYALGPDDNVDFCECERCRALDTGEYDDELERPVVTDRYIAFANQVAEGIQERHPGKMVSIFAYNNHIKPPVNHPVLPQIAVFFTTNRYCAGHGIGDPVCSSRQQMKIDLARWAELSTHVYIFDYDPAPYNSEFQWPLFGARAREMDIYKTLGVKGIFSHSSASWATLSPNFWVTGQCLWGTDCTARELLRDYCDGFFGMDPQGPSSAGLQEIADNMFSFYENLEGCFTAYRPQLKWESQDYKTIYSSRCLRACRDYLNRTLKAAQSVSLPQRDIVISRVEMVDLGFQYLENYVACQRLLEKNSGGEQFVSSLKACFHAVETMLEMNPDYIEGRSAVSDVIRGLSEGRNLKTDAPFGLVTKWNVIGPFDNTGLLGHNGVFPPEKEINLDAQYEGAEGPVAWRIIDASERLGYIDLLQHFKRQDWASIYALNYIQASHECDVQLRMGSNDGMKLWIDGELLLDTGDGGRPAYFDSDIIPVHLKAGVTPVLLKVSQMERSWGFYFRITDTDGRQYKDIRLSPVPFQ